MFVKKLAMSIIATIVLKTCYLVLLVCNIPDIQNLRFIPEIGQTIAQFSTFLCTTRFSFLLDKQSADAVAQAVWLPTKAATKLLVILLISDDHCFIITDQHAVCNMEACSMKRIIYRV